MKFYKLHGAGNDFIFFVGKVSLTKNQIRNYCCRNEGIGADGIIVIEKLYRSRDFSMAYFNSDGSSADFCANGARCAVLLASVMKFFEGNKCTFIAGDGEHKAELLKNCKIKLLMNRPESYAKGLVFEGNSSVEYFYINTGVEHVVGFFDDISAIDVSRTGKSIRNDIRFSHGTNVNFVQRINPGTLNIRTYERGVEEETRACGTGITAAGYLDMVISKDFRTRKVLTNNNAEFKVSLENSKLFLTGPAEFVFRGEI